MLKFIKNIFNLKEKSFKYKVNFCIISLLYLFICLICLVSIDLVTKDEYYMLTAGDADLVKNEIVIDTIHDSGKVYSLSVFEYRHMSILQYWLAKAESDVVVVKEQLKNLSNQELALQGEIMKQNSITNSLIVAYEAASNVNSNVNIDYVFKGIILHTVSHNADQRIKQGDVVTKINDKTFTNDTGYDALLKEAFNDNSKETMNVTILRNDEELTYTIKQDDYIYYGYPHHVILSATPKYTVHESNSGGPSAGLMQTIAIYNSLVAGDITKGYKIMGTGTINVDGSVGLIGGVKQKLIAAYNYKADIVFVPGDENHRDALAQYKKLKNPSFPAPIEVENFAQVLEVLQGLGD